MLEAFGEIPENFVEIVALGINTLLLEGKISKIQKFGHFGKQL